MVHELVHTVWGWAVQQFELIPQENPWKWNVIGLLVIAVVLSILLYHFVEEPARRWMRRMVGGGAANAEVEPGKPGDTKVHQLDVAREAISIRAV